MSTQPDPTVAAARRSRSRSRSPNSVATTIVEQDNVQTVTIIDEDNIWLLQTPQIAPGKRDDRHPSALDEGGARRLLRMQSLRHWWHIRGRMHHQGGIEFRRLKTWSGLGFPASSTSVEGIALAGPEHNVIVDPVRERALWDTWGRTAWLSIVASEKDWLVDKGYIFDLNDAFKVSASQFEFDRSLHQCPSSPFINVIP